MLSVEELQCILAKTCIQENALSRKLYNYLFAEMPIESAFFCFQEGKLTKYLVLVLQ
jgi:hypothetical protein